MSSGFILINKDKNLSSQRVDTILKKKFNLNKVGHLGTLDPLAVGLLVVGINDSTKYFKYFEDSIKAYNLRIRLGATSDSLDYEKELRDVIKCDLTKENERIDELLKSFKKSYKQYPPIYSAIKVDGSPLYLYANKKKDVEIKSRDVTIYEIKRTSKIECIDNQTYFNIYLKVSKGFYVRSFAKEFGDLLNIPAMADLIERVEVSDFKIENSIKIDDIKTIEENLINPLELLNFKKVEVNDRFYKKIINGQKLKKEETNDNSDFILFTYNSEPIAIYKEKEEHYEIDLMIKK